MPLAGGTPAGHRGWGGYGYHPVFTGTTEDQMDHSTEYRYHPQERPQERLQTTGEISDHGRDPPGKTLDLRTDHRPQERLEETIAHRTAPTQLLPTL